MSSVTGRTAGGRLVDAGPLDLLETFSDSGDVPGVVSLTSLSGVMLPTVDVEVDAAVVASRVLWKVRHRYVNPTDDTLEVVYRFPLPPGAAVAAMKATFADTVVVAELFERDKARRDYAVAVTSGRSAMLLEEEQPSTFTATLGHLPPGAEACVEMSLVGRVDVDVAESGECVARLRFPTVVAPRFGDPAVASTARSLAPPVCRWSVDIDVPGVLRSAASNTPGTFIVPASDDVRTGSRVVLNGSTPADRDVTACWVYEKPVGPVVSATFDSSVPGDRSRRGRVGGNATVCVEFHPPASTSTRPREIVVALDRSGSMDGWKMMAAKRFVERLVGSLTARDTVSVVAFDTTLEPLTDGPVPAGASHVARLVDRLAVVDARGGTDAANALMWAARQFTHTPGTDAFLVFVTDGHVYGEDACVRALGPDVRVVAVGVDAAANLGLLDKLATLTGGTAVCVSTPDEVSSVFTSVLSRLAPPALDDIVVELVSKTGRVSAVELHGPTVTFDGAVALLTGRCSLSPKAKLSARVSGTDRSGAFVTFEAPVVAGAVCDTLLWARRCIRELDDAWVTSSSPDEVETELVDVSLGFGTLSRFTAFVAVDAVARTKRSTVPYVVGRGLPHGWGASTHHLVVPVSRSFRATSQGLVTNSVSTSSPADGAYGLYVSVPSTPAYGAQSLSTSQTSFLGSVHPMSAGALLEHTVPPAGALNSRKVLPSQSPSDGVLFVERLGRFVERLAAGFYDWATHVDLVVASSKLSAGDLTGAWAEIASALEQLRPDSTSWPEFENVARTWLNSR